MKEFSKVFILDNVKSLRLRVQLLCNTEGLNVIESSNSIEFFNFFIQNNYNGNLIIMDIELRREDGFQVIKKIRDKNKNIPIIILTANNNRKVLIKAIFEGATDYILKPFEDLHLKGKINKILDSYNNSGNINQKIYNFILINKENLAEKILSRQFFYQPELKLEPKDKNDILNHITYLAEAINANSLELFNDYILWTKVLPDDLDLSDEHIDINLNCIKDILNPELSNEMVILVNSFIDAAIEQKLYKVTSCKTFIDKNNAYYNILVEYLQLLLKTERLKVNKLIMNEVEKGTPLRDIYIYIFEPALKEIGQLWHTNKITIAQEHYFTATTQLIMSFYSKMLSSNKNGLKFVAACVNEEHHDVGLKMVTNILELDGWDTYYLGADVPRKDLISFLIDQKPHVLGISVTMTFHLHKVIELIHDIRNIEVLRDLNILVGGYPFNVDKNLWSKIGADIYASNAIETCDLVSTIFKDDFSYSG